MIAHWPGHIKPNTTCDHISAFWDFLPTFADMLDQKLPTELDGISLLPELTDNNDQQKIHEYLYWEHRGRLQAIRLGDWKGVRLNPKAEIQLFNLKKDIGEKINIADKHPDVVARLQTVLPSFGSTHTEPESSKWSSGRRIVIKSNIKLLFIAS